MLPTNFTFSASERGAIGSRMLGTTDTVKIHIDDARRERTGIHARIIFIVNERVVQFDNINLEKGDQRNRFCRDVSRNLSDSIMAVYSEKAITHDVGMICQAVINWDMDNLIIDYIAPDEQPKPLTFPIYPYILDTAGSIIFAPPGTGKSYAALIMGMCIANGLTSPFNALQRPVVYVNLERPRNTFLMRDHAVRHALGFPDNRGSGVGYIHARGTSLKAVVRNIERETRGRPDTVVILDSISRTGLGTLLDDTTANQFTDIMNSLGMTWLGIGHTPRGDDKHVFGSVHFTAGCDIETRIVGSEHGHTLNLMLETVKSNDGPRNYKHAIALEFSGDQPGGLISIREIGVDDPDLVAQSSDAGFQIAQAIDRLGGKATASQIAEEIPSMYANNITRTLRDPKRDFVELGKEGRENYYGNKPHVYHDTH